MLNLLIVLLLNQWVTFTMMFFIWLNNLINLKVRLRLFLIECLVIEEKHLCKIFLNRFLFLLLLQRNFQNLFDVLHLPSYFEMLVIIINNLVLFWRLIIIFAFHDHLRIFLITYWSQINSFHLKLFILIAFSNL